MPDYKIKLKIAGVVIEMRSGFKLEQPDEYANTSIFSERFATFVYQGKRKPDILIDVLIAKKLPDIRSAKPLFITYHFQDGKENWRLLSKDGRYFYKCSLKGKEQIMFVNGAFDKVTAHLFPKKIDMGLTDKERLFIKKNNGFVWNFTDIVYDFLQVLLINYFAQRDSGIFTHSVGIKDPAGRGLLFNGKSGAGKSTTARIWHGHKGAAVLNDDRIIITRENNQFILHGSPWHGDFSDYLVSRIEPAPLERLFFIYHSPKNTARRVGEKEAFSLLYPALFPAFWNKGFLENTVSFVQDLIKKVPCYSLGFVNNKEIIPFVEKI